MQKIECQYTLTLILVWSERESVCFREMASVRGNESNLYVYETDSRKLNRINLIIMCSNLKFMETHGVTQPTNNTPVSVLASSQALPRCIFDASHSALIRNAKTVQFNFPSILMLKHQGILYCSIDVPFRRQMCRSDAVRIPVTLVRDLAFTCTSTKMQTLL